MRFEKSNCKVRLRSTIGDMQRNKRAIEAASVIGCSGRQETASSLSRAGRIHVVQWKSLANVVWEPDEVMRIQVCIAGICYKPKCDAVAQGKIKASEHAVLRVQT